MRATTAGASPCSSSATARRRRLSNSAAVPLVLIPFILHAMVAECVFRKVICSIASTIGHSRHMGSWIPRERLADLAVQTLIESLLAVLGCRSQVDRVLAFSLLVI